MVRVLIVHVLGPVAATVTHDEAVVVPGHGLLLTRFVIKALNDFPIFTLVWARTCCTQRKDKVCQSARGVNGVAIAPLTRYLQQTTVQAVTLRE